MSVYSRAAKWGRPLFFAATMLLLVGCSQQRTQPVTASGTIVVAPVLNLSGNQDLDTIKVTDWVASEFLAFPGVSVVPVNRTLAEIAVWGQANVESPEDALELARAFGADATVVTAITEYNPYDPLRVGLVMQWYEPARRRTHSGFDPVAASRNASDPGEGLSGYDERSPRWQVQRVYNAADQRLLGDLKHYAKARGGHESPYGWRVYTKSQELYVRFCSWASIQTILNLAATNNGYATKPHEAE